MNPLTDQQKELIFDYFMCLTSGEQNQLAESLISSNQQAAELYSKLRIGLSALNNLELESCPEDLVEQTLISIHNISNAGEQRLQQLIAKEQSQTVFNNNRFCVGLCKRLAIAAVFIFAVGCLITTFRVITGYLHQNSLIIGCQAQLANIAEGLSNYVADHNGQQPTVATAVGAPWYKVGDQGEENHSNTRNIFQLVKGNYVDLNDFVCPGGKSKNDKIYKVEPSQIRDYKDFPDRRCITYSIQVCCREATKGQLLCRKIIIADSNPLFENLPTDFTEPLKVSLDRNLLTLNSKNHNRHGQNVLFGDGSVEFLKSRYTPILEDDIFTLKDTDIYQGYEIPSHGNDIFLAP